jgi:glutaconate CoA-transferase subunit A
MPYAYAYDIPFHMEMMSRIQTEDGFKKWIEEWAYGCESHDDYCEKVGWNRLRQLTRIERKFCRTPFA